MIFEAQFLHFLLQVKSILQQSSGFLVFFVNCRKNVLEIQEGLQNLSNRERRFLKMFIQFPSEISKKYPLILKKIYHEKGSKEDQKTPYNHHYKHTRKRKNYRWSIGLLRVAKAVKLLNFLREVLEVREQ